MSNKLYVGNLSYSTSEEALRDAFSVHGEVTGVTIIAGRGFGFVEFADDESAEKAKEALNGAELDGRTLRVDEARPRESRAPRSGGVGRPSRTGKGRGSSRGSGRTERGRW